MSEIHTKGRLTVHTHGRITAGPFHSYTNGSAQEQFAMVTGFTRSDNPTAERDANARRLAACWNACDGIPTEKLEKAADDISPVFQLLTNATAEAMRLRAALEALIRDADSEPDSEYLQGAGKNRVAVYRKGIERARAVLAATTEAAPPQLAVSNFDALINAAREQMAERIENIKDDRRGFYTPEDLESAEAERLQIEAQAEALEAYSKAVTAEG